MEDFSDAIDAVAPAPGGAPAPAPAPAPSANPNALVRPAADSDAPPAEPAQPSGGASQTVLEQVQGQVGGVPKAKPAGGEDFSDAIDRVAPDPQQLAAKQAADAGFLQWKANNAGVDPSTALEVLRLSDATGQAPEYVAKNLDTVRKAAGDGSDWPGVMERAPGLASFLGENGIRPAAAKDDLDNLSLFSWAFHGPVTALEDGTKSLWGSARKLADATGLGGPENEKKIEELEAEEQNHGDYGAHNFFTKGVVGLAKTAPLLLVDQGMRYLVGGAAGRLLGLGGAAAAEVAGAGPEDPVADAGALGSLFVADKLGPELGSFGLNAAISYADTNWELKKMRGPDGKAIDADVRQVLALTVGTINGGVMAVAGVGGHLLGPEAEAINKEVLNRQGLEAVQRLIMDPTKMAALQRYARRFGVHEASALLVGAAQSGISDAGNQMAKVKSGQASGFSGAELLETAWNGAWKTANDMMLLSAGNAAHETHVDVNNAAAARELIATRGTEIATSESASRLQAINQAVQGKTVQGLSQKGVGDLVRKMGNQPVQIDAAAVKKLATERGVDPAELGRTIAGDDGKAWAEAERTGGELVAQGPGYVDFARKDAPGAQALLQDSRLNSDALTPRQHAEREAAFQRRAAEVAKLPPEQLADPARRVYDDFRTKSIFAGAEPGEAAAAARQVAASAHTWAEQFAEKNGGEPDAWAVYQAQDLKVTGPDGRTLGTGDFSKGQPKAPAVPDHEAVADVRAKYEKLINQPGQDEAARRYFQDPVTGLRNERAAAVAPVDESKQKVLHFGVEGVKFRNDDLEKGGHNKADELFRAVAQAAHQVDPSVYRAGGDFAVPVADEAAGKAFLEKVRAGLPEQAQGYGVTGAVGEDGERLDENGQPMKALDVARAKHDQMKKGMENATPPTRSLRGERPQGLPEGQDAGTTIPSKRVRAELVDEHRSRFAALTSTREGRDEAFHTVHVEQGTGILTRQGFDARPKRAFRASIDLNGLKRVQERLAKEIGGKDAGRQAHAFGDLMLEQFGILARASKGLDFDFAHDHGDEYLAQSDDEGQLRAFMDELREFARGTEVEMEGQKDGASGTWTYKRLMFGYGIGEAHDENAAEKALNADKLELAKSGERGTEDQPGRLDFTEGGDREAEGDPDNGHHDLDSGDDQGGAGSGAAAGGGQVEDAGVGAPAGGSSSEGAGRDAEGGGRGLDAASGLTQPQFGLESRGGRGRVDFTPPGGGTRRTFDIKLLEHADKSTLAHETFHFLNQVLGDLAQRPDAPELIKGDYAKLLEFAGYADHAQRVAEDKERRELDARVEKGHKLTATKEARRTELHAKEERLTHAWEQYLVEGKAPSSDLVGTFSRYRDWLTDIYRKVAGADDSAVKGIQSHYRRSYGQEIGLSDDVREVFGRILAAADEVKRTAAATEATRPWKELAERMTPEDRQRYEERAARGEERAKTGVVRGLVESTHRENVGFIKREKQHLRDQAENDLDKDPVYRALSYLQDGELPGGNPKALLDDKGQPQKLDKEAIRRKYDTETVRKLPRGIFAPKGEGVAPDELAELLGFQDGRDLITHLLGSVPRKQVIEAKVNEQLENIHGAALKDSPQALRDEASFALHNEDALQKVLMERRKLMELVAPGKAGHAMDLSREYLRKTAEDLIGRKSVAELMAGRDGAAGYYLRAERTAAQRMRKAFEAGKFEEALAQNERLLLNMHFYRSARDARERLEIAHDAIQQSGEEAWRTVLGKADVETAGPEQANDHLFLGTHDAVLQAIGMQPATGAPDTGAVDRLVAAVGTEGIGFDVPELRDLIAHPTMWGELTRDQAENVLAAVKNIRHAANAQLEFELTGKQMERSSWFEQAAARALKTLQLAARALTKSGDTAGEKLAAAIRGGDAWLTSVATYVDTLDGGDRDGPWHRLFIDEYRTSRETLVRLDRDVVGKVRAAIEKMPKALRARADEAVPGLPELLPPDPRYGDRVRGAATRSDIWSLFLNSGNEDNTQRLRDGNGWSDEARQKALDLLTPHEARFLQGLLDTIDSLHPELAKVYERRKGLPLGKVKATAITVNGESFRGGYFPIRYDPNISRQGAAQMADVEKKLYGPASGPSTPYSGHTKERMDTVLAPLSMEFGTTTSHLAQVTQDIAMGDFARKAGTIVNDPRFAPIVDKALGQERTKLFMPLLKDIANDRSMSVAGAAEGQPGFIRSMMAMGRSRYARGVMALNVPSMLAHLTDPLAAIGEADGPMAMAERGARLVPAYIKTLGSMKSGREEYGLSKELAYRDARETANIRKELEKVKLPENVFLRGVAHVSDVADHVSTLTRHYLDMFHSKVLWQVGYDEALAKGSDQAEAARAGDDLLAKTLPSGDIAEKSAILRSKHDLAAVVTFYGYANRMFNLWVHTPISRTVDAWSGPQSSISTRARSVGDLAAKWVAMGAIAALGAKLAGRGPAPDDDQKALAFQHWGPAGWLVRRVMLEPANTIPLLGPAMEALADGKQVSVRTAPAAELIADTTNKLEKAIEKARDNSDYDPLVWELLNLTSGTVLGPTGQFQRTGGFARDVLTGKQQPQGPGDALEGAVYGSPRER